MLCGELAAIALALSPRGVGKNAVSTDRARCDRPFHLRLDVIGDLVR
jgi:hypothetical protein